MAERGSVSFHPGENHDEEGSLTVVAKMAVQDGSQHEGLVEELVDALLVGLNADDAVLGERASTCVHHFTSAS